MSLIKPGIVILGRFEVLKQYHGGTFRVFFAVDRQKDRAIVLKFLPSDQNDAQAQKKLIKEAGILSKVKGKNVLEVYNCYLIDTGEVFISMEWAPGGDLMSYLRKHGPLEWEKARELLYQILNGLQQIHSHNIIHRDIKPGNILFADENTPLVADFGISKALTNTIEKLTQKTSIIGTPDYMAPEAIKGDKLGFATDIYSIGVLAWEMLTLKPPFTDENNNIVTLMYKQLNEKPNFDELPDEARDWVRVCMEKDINKRIASVKELRELLHIDKIPEKYLPDAPKIKKTAKKTVEIDLPEILKIEDFEKERNSTNFLDIGDILENQDEDYIQKEDLDEKEKTEDEKLNTNESQKTINKQKKSPEDIVIDKKIIIPDRYKAILDQIEKDNLRTSKKSTTRYDITPKQKARKENLNSKKAHETKIIDTNEPEEINPKFTSRDIFFFTIIGITIVIFGGLLISQFLGQNTYRVSFDGDADFTKIQEAILASGSGDSIIIGPGTYIEALVIDNPRHDEIIIVASDSGKTTLLNNDLTPLTVADEASARISGIEINYLGKIKNDAVLVDNGSLFMENCIITDESAKRDNEKNPGISVRGENAKLQLENCKISNKSYGLFVYYNAKASLSGNRFLDNNIAIEARGESTIVNIRNSEIMSNNIGVLSSGNALVEISGNTIQRNKTGIIDYDDFGGKNPLFGFIQKDSLIFGSIEEPDSNNIQGNLTDRKLLANLENKICSQCSYHFYSKHKLATCPRCFYDFELKKKRCPECNTLNPPDASGCKNCPFEFKY
ncbi:MAG: protein kinase domain-containing protein [Candidatus Zixiibacteriota bacterium]